MTAERNGSNIQLVEDGHVVAVADLETTDDPTVIRASLHTEAGHRPVGTGARLVDAVLDLDETHGGTRWKRPSRWATSKRCNGSAPAAPM